MDPYSWSWNAEAFVVLGFTAAYFLAIRGLHAPAWRIACFLGAMVMLLAVSVTPIHTLGMHYLLTMHLLQNVVLAEWAPLLVVLAIPAALAASIAGHGAVRTFTHPAVALPLWLANYMIWHLPWIYDAALESPSALLHLEHAMYFVTRTRPVVVRLPGRAAPSRVGRAGRLRVRAHSSSQARSGSSWR